MWVLDQALRRRKCGECKAKIPPKKFHLALWTTKSIKVGMGLILVSIRKNICLACVEKYAEDLKIRNDEQDNLHNKSTTNTLSSEFGDLPF